MFIIKAFVLSFLIASVFLSPSVAQAETVRFGGIVFPNISAAVTSSNGKLKIIDQPKTLVSFSDQIALAFPIDFGTDGKIRIFNDLGDLVGGLKLLSLTSESGVSTKVAVVDLLPGAKQTFLLCDGNRCVRYKVVRH